MEEKSVKETSEKQVVDPQEWYTRQEVSKICNVTVNTVANYIDIGLKTGPVSRFYLVCHEERKGSKTILGSDLIDFMEKTGLRNSKKK